MHLQSGTLLQGGKYKIIEKIGQGGFGIVYKAFHESLQSNVCIKEFFFSDLCERAKKSSKITIISSSADKIQLVDSLKKKFIKEAQRLAQFQNPHIIHVMDNFEENNTAYFVMEYIEGGSLEDLINRTGAISEEKAKKIILPIIDALEAVHNKGLLHLDIKPANILLRNDQSAILIDFGISKYMEMAGNQTTTAPIGLSKGYAPLEQYGGTIADFSKATDVYSICATLYRMVTGVIPPEPLQIHTNGIKSPNELNPQISLKFSNAILKGLSIKAIERPQNMSELKNQLIKEEIVNETVVPKVNNTNIDRGTTNTPIPPKKTDIGKIIGVLVVIIVVTVILINMDLSPQYVEQPNTAVQVDNSLNSPQTSNSQNTVNEPSKNESQQNTKTDLQIADAPPKKNKAEIITGTVTDIDGNVYQTVKIGNQVWMAENLKVTHYRNGDEIRNIPDNIAWANTTSGALCDYNNDAENNIIFGHLYNWYAVTEPRNIAPIGWHVPTDSEWAKLQDFVSDNLLTPSTIAKSLASKTFWVSYSETGSIGDNLTRNNNSGFSALPGGVRWNNGRFDYLGYGSFWWCFTENGTKLWNRYMYWNNSVVFRNCGPKENGLSVRCVKDN